MLLYICGKALTLWYQDILYGFGLDCIKHSKYTSSPSLISSGFKDEPIFSVTTGISGKKESKMNFYSGFQSKNSMFFMAQIYIQKDFYYFLCYLCKKLHYP